MKRKYRERIDPCVMSLTCELYHAGDKAIAAAGHGFYIPGTVAGFTQSPPQDEDVLCQVTLFDIFIWPDLFH